MDKNTVLEHAVSGFFQALGWMLGTAVVGVVFATLAHHAIGLAFGLLFPAVFLWRWRSRRRQERIEIYPPPTQSAELPPTSGRSGRQ